MPDSTPPLKPRARVLAALLALWITYGVALLSRVLFAANSPILESIQRYSILVSLGLLAAYFESRWVKGLMGAFALGLGAVMGIAGQDWALAWTLVAAFGVAWVAGWYLQRR